VQVQVINHGGTTDNGPRSFMVLTPDGGAGPNIQGCEAQGGYDWGWKYGGHGQGGRLHDAAREFAGGVLLAVELGDGGY
jgi:hypothetical protein